MYNSTKSHLKTSILKLIAQTDDTEHRGGRVTIDDIQEIVNEIKIDLL